MSSAQPLLKKICADPTDIDSRRVYADLLIERGDPRGVLISQQLRLDEIGLDDHEYPAVLAETHRLLANHGTAWASVIPAKYRLKPSSFGRVPVDGLNNARFESGFLNRFAVMPGQVDRAWKAVSRKEPVTGLEVIVPESIGDENRVMKSPNQFRQLKVLA